jgi:nucleotide-binding universal stress UspA family protein
VLHVYLPDTHIPGEELVLPPLQLHRRVAALRAAYDAAAVPGAEWLELDGKVRECVAAEAAKADFTVMGHAPALHYEDAWEAIKSALLDAGVPALVMPDQAGPVLGRRIALAWKPTEQAGRAVASARPLLERAAQVSVLLASEDGTHIEPPDDLLLDLERAGVAVSVHAFRPASHTGVALGAEAVRIGADVMVMGAFSHERLAAAVLGSATRDAITRADLPILLRH